MITTKLEEIWKGFDHPFFIGEKNKSLFLNNLRNISIEGLNNVQQGDVVSLIGDFNPESITTLLTLLDKGAIVSPITNETQKQHDYFFEKSLTQYVFNQNKLIKIISQKQYEHPSLNYLRKIKHAGLILFTTGTTGAPKAIIHDFLPFIARYKTPRPTLKAISFLLFDHIGGLNTLFHMLFNRGTVISIKNRTVKNVLETCKRHQIELLPTTPTFLRMLSLQTNLKKIFPKSIKIISYGTERMDLITLKKLNRELPQVDFRQTYGMSELGIMRVKSLSKDSLFMKVGGESVQTKIVDNILHIKSKNRMLGYLNAPSPFDSEGWLCTKDIVETKEDGFFKIIGRESDVINVGGLKFLPHEVEEVALGIIGIKYAVAEGVPNPITGQHVELFIELDSKKEFSEENLRDVLSKKLERHKVPIRINIGTLKVSHRFKKGKQK